MFNKSYRWLDSNSGPLVSEATTLPTAPQPLPKAEHSYATLKFPYDIGSRPKKYVTFPFDIKCLCLDWLERSSSSCDCKLEFRQICKKYIFFSAGKGVCVRARCNGLRPINIVDSFETVKAREWLNDCLLNWNCFNYIPLSTRLQ